MAGVVVFAGPGAHLVTPGARLPGEQVLEVGEPAGAAAILGRARALATGTRRVRGVRLRFGARLYDELVFPAVAEVVLIAGPVPGMTGPFRRGCLPWPATWASGRPVRSALGPRPSGYGAVGGVTPSDGRRPR